MYESLLETRFCSNNFDRFLSSLDGKKNTKKQQSTCRCVYWDYNNKIENDPPHMNEFLLIMMHKDQEQRWPSWNCGALAADVHLPVGISQPSENKAAGDELRDDGGTKASRSCEQSELSGSFSILSHYFPTSSASFHTLSLEYFTAFQEHTWKKQQP